MIKRLAKYILKKVGDYINAPDLNELINLGLVGGHINPIIREVRHGM